MKTTLFYGFLFALSAVAFTARAEKPHIIFVMADDMGWGQTGYRGHPVLKTPHLDAMAANGLRFDRFYAGGPVCSPTRASVMTGRSHDRTGVLSHGYGLRPQEKTIAQALRAAGYVTGHFGKWHLNGYRGPGAPILKDDPRGPGAFGFDEWVSVTNFFDQDPILSRQGEFVEFTGDSSDIAVAEAVDFLDRHRAGGKPMFAVIWYGTPHSPFRALDADKAPFADLDPASAHHHGELVALDRSVGHLRAKLREFGIERDTLLVFCSDNGGLPEVKPNTTGGLRGFKASVYEGGLRVPGIIEWPAVIQPRVTSHPACATDLFPTVADIVGIPATAMIQPIDGESLRPLFAGEVDARARPLGFRFGQKAALIDGRHKILTADVGKGPYELYDLEADPHETSDLAASQPALARRLTEALLKWSESVSASFAGRDYPGGVLSPPDPPGQISWTEAEEYRPFLEKWKERWEYRAYLGPSGAKKKKGAAK